jgi:hypothetical protein
VGVLSKLFGVKPATPAAPTAAALSAQREALAERLMTPERAELIAHALEVQRSKQQVFKELADKVGQERMAEILRRMMEKRD